MNHVVSVSLALANKMPTVIDVCTWQALH